MLSPGSKITTNYQEGQPIFECPLSRKGAWAFPLGLLIGIGFLCGVIFTTAKDVGYLPAVRVMESLVSLIGFRAAYYGLAVLCNKMRVTAGKEKLTASYAPVPLGIKSISIPQAVQFFAYLVEDSSMTRVNLATISTDGTLTILASYLVDVVSASHLVGQLNRFYGFSPKVVEGFEDAVYSEDDQLPTSLRESVNSELKIQIPGLQKIQELNVQRLIYRSASRASIAWILLIISIIMMGAFFMPDARGIPIAVIGLLLAILGGLMIVLKTEIKLEADRFRWRQLPIAVAQLPIDLPREAIQVFAGIKRIASSKGSSSTLFLTEMTTTQGQKKIILGPFDDLQQARAAAAMLNDFYGIH